MTAPERTTAHATTSPNVDLTEWGFWLNEGPGPDWRVTFIHEPSKSMFAILNETFGASYSIFLGVNEGGALPADDIISELSASAISAFENSRAQIVKELRPQ